MLEGLDRVNWSQLSHAYGPADDVPALIRALASGDADARDHAFQGLFSTIWHQGTVYEATAHAVPFLLELLAAPGVAEKEAIFHLLGSIADGNSYMEVHSRLWDDVDPSQEAQRERQEQVGREREHVRAARQAVEAGVGTYLDLLADEDPTVREAAISMLGLCRGRADRVIPELLARIPNQADARSRAALILAVGDLAEGTGDLSPFHTLFAERMQPEEAPVVRLAAAICLARSSPVAPTAAILDTLCQTAATAWDDFESVGGDTGGRVGEAVKGDPAARLRIFLAALDSRDASARQGARFALNRMCHERRSVTPVIVKALAEQLPAADVDERRQIVQTLAGLGAASAAAVGPLAAALDDDDSKVRGWAATALAVLGDPRAIPVLIERLQSERTLMARSLDRLGAEARALVPALIEVLGDSPAEGDIGNPPVQAALALGRIGPDARPAIPALIELMDREPDAQPYVAEAIGQIGGPEAHAAIPRLERLLSSSDEWCRIRAAQALWRLDGRAGPVLHVLDEQLHPKSRCRSLAIEVLGEMGAEAARGEVPALLACLEDRSFHRRWPHVEAAIALWRITHQPELTLPVLMKLFGDPDAVAALSRRAAEGLGEMGAEAVEALPILREVAALDVRPFGQMFSYSSDFVIEDDALLAAVTEAIRRIEVDLGRAERSTGQARR